MRRRSWLRRKTPGSLLRRTPLRSKRGSTGPDRDVVDAVYERAAWSCELDGMAVGSVRGVDHHLHHRRPRAAGGSKRPDTNSPANLLLLCPPCHEAVESRRDAYGDKLCPRCSAEVAAEAAAEKDGDAR